MSEVAILALSAMICIPLSISATALIFFRLLSHLEKTQTVGGTPKNIYAEQAAVGIEAKKLKLERSKPVPVRNVLR